MNLLPGGRKMGQFEGVSTVKMCPTLYDDFMVKSVSKCSLFTYILEYFQMSNRNRKLCYNKIRCIFTAV